jgi:chemotaxis protein histidine kinase CheA
VEADKQRVLTFFIEGAREHLDTIERGLLNLQAAIEDSEQINELFRAAHSVKGDAAMLNLTSIHKVAHHLEDCFKLLQEHQVAVDQQAESLFLRGFDALHELVDKLQSPFGLQDEEANQIVQDVAPVFAQLQSYLHELAGVPGMVPQPVASSASFSAQVMAGLRELLLLFRQSDNASSRQQLQQQFAALGQIDPGVDAWKIVTHLSERAAANPQAAYAELARVIIPELKAASDQIQAQKGHLIAPSEALKALAGPEPQAVAAPGTFILPLEPKAAAQTIVKNFDRKQLIELTNLLIRTIKGQG